MVESGVLLNVLMVLDGPNHVVREVESHWNEIKENIPNYDLGNVDHKDSSHRTKDKAFELSTTASSHVGLSSK